MCEMPIRALRLASGAEFDQSDKVKDIIAPGETLVASYLQVQYRTLSLCSWGFMCNTFVVGMLQVQGWGSG